MERMWLHNPETKGYFECPASAVKDWLGLGWERSDPPPPTPSPVVAERIEWEREQESRRQAGKQQSKTRRSAATEPKEPTDG